jgi:hypothetical protein
MYFHGKVKSYSTRPVLTCASETWMLSTSDEEALAVFERKVFRSIYGPVRDSDGWRIRYR